MLVDWCYTSISDGVSSLWSFSYIPRSFRYIYQYTEYIWQWQSKPSKLKIEEKTNLSTVLAFLDEMISFNTQWQWQWQSKMRVTTDVNVNDQPYFVALLTIVDKLWQLLTNHDRQKVTSDSRCTFLKCFRNMFKSKERLRKSINQADSSRRNWVSWTFCQRQGLTQSEVRPTLSSWVKETTWKLKRNREKSENKIIIQFYLK